jgi:hypothetical protein
MQSTTNRFVRSSAMLLSHAVGDPAVILATSTRQGLSLGFGVSSAGNAETAVRGLDGDPMNLRLGHFQRPSHRPEVISALCFACRGGAASSVVAKAARFKFLFSPSPMFHAKSTLRGNLADTR